MHSFRLIILCLLLLCVAIGAQETPKQRQTAMPPKTTDRPLRDRLATFEKEDRDSWQKPDEVIKVLNLKPGAVVADVGAGSGYFTRRLARAVGDKGRVYAVDVDAEILSWLKDEAGKMKLSNVEIVISKDDDPMLKPDSVDLIFVCDTAHHIANRVPFYRKLAAALKKGGRFVNLDIPPDAHAKGLCRHDPEMLVPREEAIEEAAQAGFKLDKEYNFVLPKQYYLVFKKK
ncbi:MAG: methyltransferase domain-containing protein [Blastocatellia bacterium]